MSNQNDIIVGDRVRVRYGSHTGEIATVTNIMWHSNQYGSYARVHLSFEGGEAEDRGMGSLEKAHDSRLATPTGH